MPESSKQSFWQTLPGVLTALAAVITALTGLVIGLLQNGVFSRPAKTSAVIDSPANDTRSSSAVEASEPRAGGAVGGSPSELGSEGQGQSDEINLLSVDNGGQLVVARGGDNWRGAILGPAALDSNFVIGDQPEAIYAFRGNATVEFDRFRIYKSTQNPSDIKRFELQVGNETATGSFRPIGTFEIRDVVYVDNPYQEFKFAPVHGRYFKVKLLMRQDGGEEGFQVWQFQLMGRLN